jgi:hypothetical protein
MYFKHLSEWELNFEKTKIFHMSLDSLVFIWI